MFPCCTLPSRSVCCSVPSVTSSAAGSWPSLLCQGTKSGGVHFILLLTPDPTNSYSDKWSSAPQKHRETPLNKIILLCFQEQSGITAWRILNDHPYLKLSFGTEESEVGRGSWLRFLPVVSREAPILVRRMKVTLRGLETQWERATTLLLLFPFSDRKYKFPPGLLFILSYLSRVLREFIRNF